jgi:hypothetical protein
MAAAARERPWPARCSWHITISGAALTGGTAPVDATPVNDHGSVVLTAGGFSTGSVPYGPGTANPTAASAATALASALSVAGSGYTASANGATGIAVTTSAFSASGNGISISVHGTSADPADFPSASFNVPAASLNGGINPDPSGLSLPLVTQYQYDALGNLLRVDQKGTALETARSGAHELLLTIHSRAC